MLAGTMRCLQDVRFWLAVLAAPIAWLLLWLAGLPVNRTLPDPGLLLRVVVLYPVLEELVFRGGLQMLLLEKLPRTGQRVSGLSLANLSTSLLFAALHLYTHAPVWAMLVVLPSLVFGWAMERYRQVSAPILLHVFYNAGFVLLFVD